MTVNQRAGLVRRRPLLIRRHLDISPIRHHINSLAISCFCIHCLESVIIKKAAPYLEEVCGIVIHHNSRLSLLLSEVGPPRYTGHLVWHGLLARCLLHDHSLFRILASAGCPKLGFQCLLWLDMTFCV